MPHALLFVDDDPLFLDRCKNLFSDSPYTLYFAASPGQALVLLQDGLEPVVAVVGQDMAEMTGPQFLVKLKDQQPHCQFILAAGQCDQSLVMQAVNKSGLFRFYAKDVEDAGLKRGVIDGVSHYLNRLQSIQVAKKVVESKAELEDLTLYLEKRVESHTHKLQQAYDKNVQLTNTLKRTVRELEGRDCVLRHLLTIHTLEDTLQTILEVLNDVLSIRYGIIHVVDEDGVLQPSCIFPKDSNDALSSSSSKLVQDAFSGGQMEVAEEGQGVQASVAVPICKGDTVLGVIEVVWGDTEGEKPCGEVDFLENCQTIYNFAIHAAIAVCDHNISSDKSSWSKTIDDVLLDLMD